MSSSSCRTLVVEATIRCCCSYWNPAAIFFCSRLHRFCVGAREPGARSALAALFFDIPDDTTQTEMNKNQSTTICKMKIAAGMDAIHARRKARQIGHLLGLDRSSQMKMATAVCELASNAIQ